MQKKLIALALASLSGAAFAQSNVNISGEFKLGFENVTANGATAANANLTSRTRVSDSTSYLRFTGEEKLGNGLTAWFQVETDINASGVGGTLGNRNTAVGLKGDWGNVFMGKWDAHYSEQNGAGVDDGGKLSLNHATRAVSIISQAPVVTAAGGANANGVVRIGDRLPNLIAYLTPDFSGFSGKIAYGTGSEDTTANIRAKDSNLQLAAYYRNGPINAFYSYLSQKNIGATGALDGYDLKGNRLGVAYKFGEFKVGLIWDTTKSETRGVALASNLKRSAWALPVSYVTGPHGFYYTYARANNTSGTIAGAAIANDTGAALNVLAYNYSLSKRTDVGVSWARISNKTNGQYDFWDNSVSGNGRPANLPRGADPSSLSFNLRHAF